MSNRRRAARFVVPESAHGTLRLMQDVYVERVGVHTIDVLASSPLPLGEGVWLELPSEFGARSAVQVTVDSSGPVSHGDTRRHRLGLGIVPQPRACTGHGTGGTSTEAAVPGDRLPALGVLIRSLPVRVRDFSTSGCLIESLDALPEGSVGLLELAADGRQHCETIHVCRASRHGGSPWPWRAGAHFLALAAPSATSVRNLLARFEIMDEIGHGPDVADGRDGAESTGSASSNI
jgi:hypothetical protein